MRTKPWPLVVLALCYFLSPLANTLMGAHLMRLPYGAYLANLFQHSSWLVLFATFLLYPIAGLAIIAMKRWSYPFYLAVMLVTLYLNYRDWRFHQQSISLPLFIVATALNVGLVTYFLLPAVRTPYLDRRLRWWEAKPRYIVNEPALLKFDGNSVEGTILNISQGGLFLKCDKHLELTDDASLECSIAGQSIRVAVKLKYRLTAQQGYGLEFRHTQETQAAVSIVIRELKRLGTKTRNEKPEWKQDLKNWAYTAVTTGKGWVPQFSKPAPINSEPENRATSPIA